MLVELGVVEQRSKAVFEVLDGASVTEVARRYGVCRQTVHDWLRRYANDGFSGLVDKSSRPASCPHQTPPVSEAAIVALRLAHPAWGPDRIVYELARKGITPLPSRSAIYRALVRHGLIDPRKRRRKRDDYKRWERHKAMELWQMDLVGGFHLKDGTELKMLSGIDDHSRFCVSARLVLRATAQPVTKALLLALRTYGAPRQILTDNGRVFTSRFSTGPGPVLFDRICHDNGIDHLLTAPYSPTTTGKVERFHKTLRAEFFRPNENLYSTIEAAQEGLDTWVCHYNTERPHQSVGMKPPAERFMTTGGLELEEPDELEADFDTKLERTRPPGVSRWVDQSGKIGLGGFRYRVGPGFAGEAVEVVCRSGLVEILHAGVLIATHAERRRPDGSSPRDRAQRELSARRPNSGLPVVRIVDSGGTVSFAGAPYRVGRSWARQSVEVAVVASSVQISKGGRVLRVHQIRHDRTKEWGAYATPKGRPRKDKPEIAG